MNAYLTNHALQRHAERVHPTSANHVRGNDVATSRREILRDLDTPLMADIVDFVGDAQAKITISTDRGPVTYVLRGKHVVTCYPANRPGTRSRYSARRQPRPRP